MRIVITVALGHCLEIDIVPPTVQSRAQSRGGFAQIHRNIHRLFGVGPKPHPNAISLLEKPLALDELDDLANMRRDHGSHIPNLWLDCGGRDVRTRGAGVGRQTLGWNARLDIANVQLHSLRQLALAQTLVVCLLERLGWTSGSNAAPHFFPYSTVAVKHWIA